MRQKFDGILLASDVDDTLAFGGKISKENMEAIRYFTENGGLFTVATGRTPAYIRENYMPELKINAPLIAINGTAIADVITDEILWKCPLPSGFEELVLAAKQVVPLENALAYLYGQTDCCMEQSAFLPETEYFKLLFVTHTEEEGFWLKQTLKENYPDYDVSRSWSVGVEAVHKNAGKGAALRKLKEYVKASCTIGVGNYENDLSLLQAADIGIAVENAVDSLKEAADLCTVSSKNHAIAEIIYHIEEVLKHRKTDRI